MLREDRREAPEAFGEAPEAFGEAPEASCEGPEASCEAPRPVDDDGGAHEFDCLACGACCRTGYDGRILVPAEDLVRWRAIGRADLAERVQPGHFGELAFATRSDGSCVHLGTPASPNACAIYEIRGTTCREFERGSWQCREFRRDFGIDPPRMPGNSPRIR